MLSKREAFKVAFLLRCAEAGLTLEETHGLVKQAFGVKDVPLVGSWIDEGGKKLIGGVSDLTFKTIIPAALKATMLGVFGLPLVAGGMGGYALAKARGINDQEPEEYQMSEKITALRNAAERARMNTKLRRQREKGKTRGRRTPALV